MPNWCENRVKISGDNLENLLEVIKKDGEIFVSKSFIQTPKELTEDTELTKEELKEKFGFDDWYDWNCKNLGTKWDFKSCGDSTFEEGRIEFYCLTAWSPPLPFFEKLSAMYNCEVEILYAETGMWYSGMALFQNGEVIEEMDFETCYTDFGLAVMEDDLSWKLDDEDDVEMLLELSEDEKEAIIRSEVVADEVKSLLTGDAA